MSHLSLCTARIGGKIPRLLKSIQLSQDTQLQGAMELYKAKNEIRKQLVVVRANGFHEGKVLNTSHNESFMSSEKAHALFKAAKID